jgi:mono/diheme cytochrome c family protein
MTRQRLALLALALAGCQQQMAHQPAYRPLEPSVLFADQRSARPLLRGTVPWGQELRQGPFYTGRVSGEQAAAAKAAAVIAVPGAALAAVDEKSAPYLDHVPIEPAQLAAQLRRGQERFNIYCSPCHDRAGTGRGMIVERGFTPPPSFHRDRQREERLKGQPLPLSEIRRDLSRGYLIKGQQISLTEVPVGYIFEVISDGFGAMPSYGKQVPPADRWAIVAYLRGPLQFHTQATLDDVADPQERARLLKQRGQPQ